MTYHIYIQNNFLLSLEANDTDDALKIIGEKIANKEIIFDESKPKDIRIEPQ